MVLRTRGQTAEMGFDNVNLATTATASFAVSYAPKYCFDLFQDLEKASSLPLFIFLYTFTYPLLVGSDCHCDRSIIGSNVSMLVGATLNLKLATTDVWATLDTSRCLGNPCRWIA